MKTDLVYLRHILDATLKIESYVSVGREAFMRELPGLRGQIKTILQESDEK